MTAADWHDAHDAHDAQILRRLNAKSERDPKTGCLRWTGAHNHEGYGEVRVAGKTRKVHRVAWELQVGSIPEGAVLDHVADRGCVYRDCFEITHLEPVTGEENNRRSASFSAINARKSHCDQGHPLPGPNAAGKRVCRPCARASQQRSRARKAAANV